MDSNDRFSNRQRTVSNTILLIKCRPLNHLVPGQPIARDLNIEKLLYFNFLQLNCYLDPRGASCRKMYIDLTEEKPEPVALPPPPPPPVQIIPEPPPPIPSGRTASLDDSSDELSNDKRASHWERDRVVPSDVSSDPRHISRRRDSSNNHRSEYNSSRCEVFYVALFSLKTTY